MEVNVLSFCSLLAKKIRLCCGRALINEKLQGDYFFNRASIEDCSSGAEMQVAKKFWEKGMDCCLYFQTPSRLPTLDTMHVLVSRSVKKNQGDVVQIGRRDLPTWIDVFCRSFGVPGWKGEVERIMNSNFEKLQLLLSYKDGTPAGCAALYKKSGLTGMYCLGTLSNHRGEGLARNILAFAQEKTDLLFLQTLESERLVGLYKKSGFVQSHIKQICVLKRPN
jgi:hypothetical protein